MQRAVGMKRSTGTAEETRVMSESTEGTICLQMSGRKQGAGANNVNVTLSKSEIVPGLLKVVLLLYKLPTSTGYLSPFVLSLWQQGSYV